MCFNCTGTLDDHNQMAQQWSGLNSIPHNAHDEVRMVAGPFFGDRDMQYVYICRSMQVCGDMSKGGGDLAHEGLYLDCLYFALNFQSID